MSHAPYLSNITRTGGPQRSSPYRARLDELEVQLTTLNNLRRADHAAVANKAKLQQQEEYWTQHVTGLQASFKRIANDLARAEHDADFHCTTISRAQEIIAAAQAMITDSKLKLIEVTKQTEDLTQQRE